MAVEARGAVRGTNRNCGVYITIIRYSRHRQQNHSSTLAGISPLPDGGWTSNGRCFFVFYLNDLCCIPEITRTTVKYRPTARDQSTQTFTNGGRVIPECNHKLTESIAFDFSAPESWYSGNGGICVGAITRQVDQTRNRHLSNPNPAHQNILYTGIRISRRIAGNPTPANVYRGITSTTSPHEEVFITKTYSSVDVVFNFWTSQCIRTGIGGTKQGNILARNLRCLCIKYLYIP